MAGLLLELRRQIRNNHRKNANYSRQKTSQTVSQQKSGPEIRASSKKKDISRDTGYPDTVIPMAPDTGDMGAEYMSEEASLSTTAFMPDVKWLMHIYERNMSIVSKDDVLLKQIDEFRERAQQLQDMLDSRESQAEELRTLVDERQVKAEELGQILKERQEKADGLTAAVEKSIDAMIERVGIRLEQIESSIKNDVSAKVEQLEASVKNDVGVKIDRLEASVKNDVGVKIDRVGTMMGHSDVSARLDQLEETLRADLSDSHRVAREQAAQQSAQQLQETREALEQILQQLITAKGELSDKMHSETVKCYRNIQELYKGMDDRLEKINQINDVEDSVKGTKSFGLIAVVLSIVNLLGVIGVLLMSMGLF